MALSDTITTYEDILDPELPIVDSHHQMMHRPQQRYLFEDMLGDIRLGHNIRATVYIESRAMSRPYGPEAMRQVGETEFANGVAAMSASGIYGDARVCAAIVGYADLALGDAVDEVLDAHIAAGGGRFRGIRQGAYWDASSEVYKFVSMQPPKDLLSNPGFRDGIRRLFAKKLSFDAVVFHPQLPDVAALARDFPEGSIILNHMGFPLGVGPYAGRRAEVFETWKRHMKDLATCPNVTVKAGGLGIQLWGFDFHQRATRPSSPELAEAWRPYVETTIELFGPSRCMFESNFPADRPSCDFVALWNAIKIITAPYSAGERNELFSGTAARTYGITLG